MHHNRTTIPGLPFAGSSTDARPTSDRAGVVGNVAGVPNSEEGSKDESEYDPAAVLIDIPAPDLAFPRKRQPTGFDYLTQNSAIKRSKWKHGPLREMVTRSISYQYMPQLPAEIWQHIFTFLPPRTLGGLLLVNKLFYRYLDPSIATGSSHSVSSTTHTLPTLKPDAIWQASRRRFWPRMPVPLKGKFEIDMWRLACARSCQFCDLQEYPEAKETIYKKRYGPGPKGVSPVFPFSIISCGRCIAKKSIKIVDLLSTSTTPSTLLTGLPNILLTPDFHIVAPQSMHTDSASLGSQATKVFWGEQVENIKAEFEAVKKLGLAATEEWMKGLEARGKLALADASRWEKWFMSGGVQQMRMESASTSRQISSAVDVTIPASSMFPNGLSTKINTFGPGEVSTRNGAVKIAQAGNLNTASPGAFGSGPGLLSRSQAQQKRTKEEATELKAQRRADIEHRASQLNPPITSGVLAHIPSFQAALQIITPLTDSAWKLLEPRLLAQREEAEERERDSTANTRALQEISENRVDKLQEVSDEDWNEVQGPLRARISGFAEEIIRDNWKKGKKVKRKTCIQFAAEVLLYVRKRFYAELAKDTAAARAAGTNITADPPEGPWTQKLTLENMKWVFDIKIRPFTDAFRKELFVCNRCPGNSKKYSLEAVTQHYAAKHTSTLSKGNAVVYWRAEWPEESIFNPEPGSNMLPDPGRKLQHQPLADTQLPLNYNSHIGLTPGNPAVPMAEQPNGCAEQETVAAMPSYANMISTPKSSFWATMNNKRQPHQLDNEAHMFDPMADFQYSHFHAKNYPKGGYSMAPREHPFRLQVDFMAKITCSIWGQLSIARNLPASVKLRVTIHHIAKAFQQEFLVPAPLETFMEGLERNRGSMDMLQVSHLHCKACLEFTTLPFDSNEPFTFDGLVNHFYNQHGPALKTQAAPLSDWRVDMVLLPDVSLLRNLLTGLQNNKSIMRLITDAIPWALEDGRHSYDGCNAQGVGLPDDRQVSINSVPPPPPISTYANGWHQLQPTNSNAFSSARPFLQPASVVYGLPENSFLLAQSSATEVNSSLAIPARSRCDGGQIPPGASNTPYTVKHKFPTRQVIQCGTKPSPYFSNDAKLGNGHDYKQEPGFRSTPVEHSPSAHYPQSRHMPTSARQVYASASERSPSERYIVHPHYINKQLPPYPVPPFEAYELVEVRDPQGNFYIKRPIQQVRGGFYDDRQRASASSLYIDSHASERALDFQPSQQRRDYHSPLVNSTRCHPAEPPGDNEYDPRFP